MVRLVKGNNFLHCDVKGKQVELYGSLLSHHFGFGHIYSGHHSDFICEGTFLCETRENIC